MILLRPLLALAALALPAAVVAAPPLAPTPVAEVMRSTAFAQAARTLDAEHDRTVADIVRITEIPAPPFKEAVRAAAWREMLVAHGLADAAIDEEGNVVAVRKGSGGGPAVVISAHLDTVFPEDTDVTVRREGTRLMAPGVGDDARGLAVILAWLRAMDAARIATRSDIIILGTVGEEGEGDLRGVRHFFAASPHRQRVAAFVSVDGIDPANIVNAGVGSKRYRLTYQGPGGHSYNAFGIVNPMSAMARAIVGLYALQVPGDPKTTYSASVIEGGTSVNSIPDRIIGQFDLRSADAAALASLDGNFRLIANAAADAENGQRSTEAGAVRALLEPIGDRPAGATPASSPLVVAVRDAVAAHGFTPRLAAASTDANLPMSIGVPAVTIGSGGTGGRAHALDEWIDVEKGASVKGMSAGLAALLAIAGAELD